MGEAAASISIEVPDGETFTFSTPLEMETFQEKVRQEWQWLNHAATPTAWAKIESMLNSLRSVAQSWREAPRNDQRVEQVRTQADQIIRSLFNPKNALIGNKAMVAAILQAKETAGPDAAAGLASVLAGAEVRLSNQVHPSFFNGIIRGYLFQNNLDWSGEAHHQVLDGLEATYKKRIADQDARLTSLAEANRRLNDAHDTVLKEKAQQLSDLTASKGSVLDELHQAKSTAMDELYAAKQAEFAELSKKGEAEFKAIQRTFRDELALRQPITYWEGKQRSHGRWALFFAIASIAALAGAYGILSYVIRWAFGTLGPDKHPEPWQLGVVVVTAFFVIWVVRIFVRLFLSRLHLSTDAEERVTMVQTFLSLSLEEKGIDTKDRAVILAQLFRPASDGLVKDDAAPPNVFELLTRKL